MRTILSVLTLILSVSFSASLGLAQKKGSKKQAAPAVEETAKPPSEVKGLPSDVKGSAGDTGKPAATTPGPGAPVDPKTYKLGPEDVVWVSVWREPDLSRIVVIRPDGKITMPLVGEVQAADQTPEQLSKNITEALSQIMTKPEVSISVQQVNSKKYYIVGEVSKTGAFPLVVPTTILEALSSAGGLREFANGSKITVVRGTKRIKFNYREVIKGKNLAQNILLEPGDQIIVP
jgi:polysaccharide biosynthesis/export protein